MRAFATPPLSVVFCAVFAWASDAAAQGVTDRDIEGTWELTAAENLPYEEDLVFARLTFDRGDLYRTFVLLDPDDGELIGQIEDDRYLISDGQLIVRNGRDVTVWDVTREAGELTVHDLETDVVLRLRAADPSGALDPMLVGAWRPAATGGAGRLRFFPDGTAEVGNKRRDYVVAGAYLIIGDEPARYAVDGVDGARRLVLGGEDGDTIFFQDPEGQ